MKKPSFLWNLFLGVIGLVSLGGCQWFADNPMFPTAKIAIEAVILDPTGEEAYSGVLGYTVVVKVIERKTEEGTIIVDLVSIPTILRSVKFSFRPLNKVGAEIKTCKVDYYTSDGRLLSPLTIQFDTFISVVPPGTPMSAVYSETQGIAASENQLVLEIYTPEVEAYMRQNRVFFLKARVTFSGTDYAGHQVSYTKEFPIKAFTGIASTDIGSIWYSCTADKEFVFGVEVVNNAEWIAKVDFYVNGEFVSSRSTPPFVSSPVNLEDMCFPVELQVVVVDVLGNKVTKSTRLDSNPCSCP